MKISFNDKDIKYILNYHSINFHESLYCIDHKQVSLIRIVGSTISVNAIQFKHNNLLERLLYCLNYKGQ